jgi:hypothetical protein
MKNIFQAMDTFSKKWKPSESRFLTGVGLIGSVVCAIHCTAMPFLLVLTPLSGMALDQYEGLEIFLVLFSFVLALLNTHQNYKDSKNYFLILTLGMAIGLRILSYFLGIPWSSYMEAMAAVVLSINLFWNYRINALGISCST